VSRSQQSGFQLGGKRSWVGASQSLTQSPLKWLRGTQATDNEWKNWSFITAPRPSTCTRLSGSLELIRLAVAIQNGWRWSRPITLPFPSSAVWSNTLRPTDKPTRQLKSNKAAPRGLALLRLSPTLPKCTDRGHFRGDPILPVTSG